MAPQPEHVPLAVVAKKWNYSEDDLISWAMQKEFYLYCFVEYFTGSPCWLTIGSEIGFFSRGDTSVSCSDLHVPVNWDLVQVDTNDSFSGTPIMPDMNIDWPPKVEISVKRSDLYLHRGEIAEMEKKHPDLIVVAVKFEKAINPGGSKSPEQSDQFQDGPTVIRRLAPVNRRRSQAAEEPCGLNDGSRIDSQEQSDIILSKEGTDRNLAGKDSPEPVCPCPATYETMTLADSQLPLREADKQRGSSATVEQEGSTREKTPTFSSISEPVNLLQNKDDFESVSSVPPESEMGSIENDQPSLPPKAITKSNSNTQANEPKRTKQSKEKIEKSDQKDINEFDESLVKNKELLAVKQDFRAMGYLKLTDIIGDSKKGIQAIIPVSRSSWYAGIKSDKYPKPIKLGPRSVGWKISVIMELLENMEKEGK